MYGGRRVAYLDEIRFVPVPNASTRIEGALSGLYHYADALPVESLPRLEGQAQVEPIVLKPFGWPFMFFNAKAGAAHRPGAAPRGAGAASTSRTCWRRRSAARTSTRPTEPGIRRASRSTARRVPRSIRRRGDPEAAQKLASEAGYDGQPIRIMVSKQYDFHFKMAQVAAEYMRAAGFTVDLQVLDWATLLERRNDPAVWEIFFTHGPILPEPTLYSFMNSGAPGWWATPARDYDPGRLQRRAGSGKAGRRLGQPAAADLRGGAGCSRRQLQRPGRSQQRARRAAAGGMAVLLERLAQAIGQQGPRFGAAPAAA